MTAPAQFRRITKRTKVTAPCVLARQEDLAVLENWDGFIAHTDGQVEDLRSDYTHWLPIQWPEVRR